MRQSPLLVAILAALGGCSETFEDTGCKVVPPETTVCESKKHVNPDDLFLRGKCGDDLEITEILSDGERTQVSGSRAPLEVCCYRVEVVDHDSQADCIVGRPYRVNGAVRVAPLLRELCPADDLAPLNNGEQPNTLKQLDGSKRAAAWANAGLAEHASIAAFTRLALQLLAHAAPAALLTDAYRAAADEVRHAELCFEMARRLGQATSGAGPFPFEAQLDCRISLAEIVYAAVREGCIAETLGAHVTLEAAALIADSELATSLRQLAAEESEHAVLSYRIVAWALRVGSDEVRAAAHRAWSEPWPSLDVAELALRCDVSETLLRTAAKNAKSEVMLPAMKHLMQAA